MTLHRHRRAVITGATGVGLIIAGRYAHQGFTYNGAEFGWVTVTRIILIGIAVLIALSVVGMFAGALASVTGNGKASLGQGLIFSSLLWVASDKADLDWRAIRWVALGVAVLIACALAPVWIWGSVQAAGAALLVGMVLGWFWTPLFGDNPRWGRYVPWIHNPQVIEPAGDYWRDARSIKRGWDKLMQQIASSTEQVGGAKAKMPKLVQDPAVSERAIELVVEPPPEWNRDGVAKLAGVLAHQWNGVQSQVRAEPASRMSRRRMRIQIAMTELPESIPPPDSFAGAGAPLGEDLMGGVMRLHIGSRGVPHVLVAGQSGSGKSSGMRVIGLGMVAQGARVVCIDPKGEGDLEGITTEATLFRPAEWADWFDYVWSEQERRSAVKLAGGDPGPPIVTMIDELTQIATGMGARDDAAAKHLKAAHQAYMRLIFIGRGTGLHIISGIQQASAEAMGGRMATAVRDQHLGRVLFGRTASKENRQMVLGDRLLTPDDVEAMMDAPPGRAWVSGMSPRDTGVVHCIQFYDVPERAGALPATRPTAPTPPVQDSPAPVVLGERRHLADIIDEYVHTHGPTERAVLARLTDPPVPVTTMRNTLRRLRDRGRVTFDDGPQRGNTPVVVHPAGEWPPVDTATG